MEEEEPEGDEIVGLAGEALQPPGMDTTFTQIKFPLYGYVWATAPLALWLLGETSREEKGEAEELEAPTPK